MARHIAYDVGAAGVCRALAEALDSPCDPVSDFSRLVIDPNRGEDDPTLLMKLYDGTIIPGNRHADAAELERRLDRCYRPYHAAYAQLAARRPDTVIVRHPFLHPCLRAARRALACGHALFPPRHAAVAPLAAVCGRTRSVRRRQRTLFRPSARRCHRPSRPAPGGHNT
jgi:predicted N-formylglutamate amidohydrolase